MTPYSCCGEGTHCGIPEGYNKGSECLTDEVPVDEDLIVVNTEF